MIQNEKEISVVLLAAEDREYFITRMQTAFQVGYEAVYGADKAEVLPRQTVEKSLSRENAETYLFLLKGQRAGGAVILADRDSGKGELEFLFVDPDVHNRGIGAAAWKKLEAMYPEVKIWETYTPYFEKRNIHFYVNKCGFHIVEYFCGSHPASIHDGKNHDEIPEKDLFFRFEKVISDSK